MSPAQTAASMYKHGLLRLTWRASRDGFCIPWQAGRSECGIQNAESESVRQRGLVCILQFAFCIAGVFARYNRVDESALIDASWIVNARAETTVHALGSLIRPRQVVKVEGTGAVDDGDYFVWKVTHTIDTADHKMAMELRRNAVGANA